MAKPATAPRDGVTVVIPAHNAAPALDKVLPAWGAVLNGLNRPFEIIVVDDGSTDNTAVILETRAKSVPNLRAAKHDTRRGFGACLRTALAQARQPLLLYAGVDYPYTPSDIKPMLERIELRDEILGKQPDLISGARAGQDVPTVVVLVSAGWKWFWRLFAGLPITPSQPWYGWGEWWYRARVGWVYGVPLADVNSAFKLYRTAFLKRFPIQSEGDFVHTELVAKATFLTSIMDEIPLTQKTDAFPALGPLGDDKARVFYEPEFAFEAPAATTPPAPQPEATASQPPAPSAPPPDAPPAPPPTPPASETAPSPTPLA